MTILLIFVIIKTLYNESRLRSYTMDININTSIAGHYTGPTQTVRVMTENWVWKNMYCPVCGNSHLEHFENNRPVADFYCSKCKSQFELKSQKVKFGKSIVDGAYDKMISRITSNDNPDFMFLHYSKNLANYSVSNMFFVPKHFFTPEIIVKRNPLSEGTERAGWVGCKILLEKIPAQGRIPLIVNGVAENKEKTIKLVNIASRLRTDNIESRGWLFDVLNCVNEIPHSEFSLSEIYTYENRLKNLHPDNNNVQAKIRQQLQMLRDAGFIEFLGRGHYRKVDSL